MLCGESSDRYWKHWCSRQVEHISRAINATDISIKASSFIELDQQFIRSTFVFQVNLSLMISVFKKFMFGRRGRLDLTRYFLEKIDISNMIIYRTQLRCNYNGSWYVCMHVSFKQVTKLRFKYQIKIQFWSAIEHIKCFILLFILRSTNAFANCQSQHNTYYRISRVYTLNC